MKGVEERVVFGLMNSRHLLLVSIEIGECQGLIVWIQDFSENGFVALLELRQG